MRMMIRLQKYHLCFFLLLYFSFVQVPVLLSGSIGSTLNTYHVLFSIGAILSARYFLSRSFLSSAEFVYFALAAVFVSLATFKYGLHLRSVLVLFPVFAFVCGYGLSNRLSEADRLKVYEFMFWCLLATVIVRNILFLNDLANIYSRSTMVSTETVFYLGSGGRNLEATLLSMFSILLVRSKLYLPMLILAAVTSLLMMSRAGIIASMLSLGLYLHYNDFLKRPIALALLYFCIASAGLGSFFEFELFQRLSISGEVSLARDGHGRLALWDASYKALKADPLGYSPGYSMEAISDIANYDFKENNVHNIFLQIALDLGLVCVFLFVCCTFKHVYLMLKKCTVESGLVFSYFMLGFVQFTGHEAYAWFFAGVSCLRVKYEE